MNRFNYTPEEKCLINCAIRNNIPWSDPRMKPVRDKIKHYYLQTQDHHCCYCRRKLTDFNFENNIEHILPKSKYNKNRFSPFNLAVSCQRCNLKIKKADVSFLTQTNGQQLKKRNSVSYKFIHPNLDNFEEHIAHHIIKCGNLYLEKYVFEPLNQKANFTYHYFKLRALERESFDTAQGLRKTESLNRAFAVLLDVFGQQI